MKRTIFVTTLCWLASTATAVDLSSWIYRHRGDFPTDFSAIVWSPSGSKAVAVGSDGGAAWSHDGGGSWTFSSLDTPADSTGVAWQDEDHVWATGSLPSGWSGSGALFHSDDGGKTWATVIDDHPTPLTSIAFADFIHGFAGQPANGLLVTRNGGASWFLDEHPDIGLADVRFLDSLVGLAAGTGFDFTLHRTTNAGSDWTPVYDCPDGTITGISIPDGVNGFLSSPVSVASSNDGGLNWTPLAAVPETWIVDIAFADSLTGWLAGSGQNGNDRRGVVLRSDNGGTIWNDSGLEEPDRITSLALKNSSPMLAAGNGGTLLSTDDGGATWQNLAAHPANHFMSVHMDNETQGWAAGPVGTVHQTVDGGASWVSIGGLGAWTLESITRADASSLYACGSYAFAASDDNGATWQMRHTYLNCHSLWFFDTLNGLAGTQYGVFFTDDGGHNWTMAEEGGLGLGGVFDFDFFNSSHGFAAAGIGRILETVDGGRSWTTVHSEPSGFNSYLRGIRFATATTGFAVGMDGVILKTTNGGNSWSHQTSGIDGHLNAVEVIDANNVVAAGHDGTILLTSNGGSTWEPASSGTSADLWAIDLSNPAAPLVFGDWGTVLVPGSLGPIFADGFESGNPGAWSSTSG